MDTAFPIWGFVVGNRRTGVRLAVFTAKRSRRLSPAVGRPCCPHQRVAQLAQFTVFGPFLDGDRDILGGTSDLVDAVRELGGLVGGQDDGIRRQRGPPDHGALLIGALPAGLPAVLPPPTKLGVGDFTTTPATGLRLETTCHGPDCKPPRVQIPVSSTVESGTARRVAALLIRTNSYLRSVDDG